MARQGLLPKIGKWGVWTVAAMAALALSSAARAGDPSQDYANGMSLLAQGKLLEARAALSSAIFSDRLSLAQEASAAKALTKLAQETLFSSTVYEDDPVAFSYTLGAGESLSSAQRKCGANVPTDLLERINNVRGENLRAGQAVKLLRGPFRAQIHKAAFAMYVYLGSGDQKVFVRKVKVALGKNDATPEGMFRVAGKAKHATWVPPKSMAKKYTRPVEWGQKGYPLGKDGLFMSLRGIEAATRNVKGYGIHGTNAQWSIGKPRSHGCIRVGEGDIGQVFSLMSEGASTVQIVH